MKMLLICLRGCRFRSDDKVLLSELSKVWGVSEPLLTLTVSLATTGAELNHSTDISMVQYKFGNGI